MKRNTFYILLNILLIALFANTINAQTKTQISQTEMVNFPQNGDVKIEVIETIEKPTKIVFSGVKNKKEIAKFKLENGENYYPYNFDSFTNPITRFRVLKNVKGMPETLIQAVAVSPGGFDHSFWNILFAEVDGKIKMLTPNTTENSIQGGVHIGNLGEGNGFGMAVYTFLWEDGEARNDQHRYKVDLYKYDDKKGELVLSKSVTSKEKYVKKTDALKELGFGHFQNHLNDFEAIKTLREDDIEYPNSDNEKTADTHYKEGKEYINQNDLNAALASFNKAAKLGSTEPEVYFYLGQLHSEMNEHKEAVAKYTKALELKPNFTQALALRAYSYAEMKGQIKNAIKDADELVKRFPKGNDGEFFQLMRGYFYQQLGNKTEAENNFKAVLAIEPSFEEARVALKNLKLSREEVIKKANDIIENESPKFFLDFMKLYPEISKETEMAKKIAEIRLLVGNEDDC